MIQTKKFLIELGLDLYWTVGSPIPDEMIHFYIREKSKEVWREQITRKAKLRKYRELKFAPVVSTYAAANIPKRNRSLLGQLVCGCLKLQVETGRYDDELLDERICQCCDLGLVEDEDHFLFVCPAYRAERTDLNTKIANLTMHNLLNNPFLFGKYITDIWYLRQELLLR